MPSNFRAFSLPRISYQRVRDQYGRGHVRKSRVTATRSGGMSDSVSLKSTKQHVGGARAASRSTFSIMSCRPAASNSTIVTSAPWFIFFLDHDGPSSSPSRS